MVKIAIVEDEKQVYEQLVSYLKQYAKTRDHTISTTHFSRAEPFLNGEVSEYDAVFMDIELPSMDGFSAVRELRKIDSEAVVIFVTNLAQYAVKGYEVSAFDFVIKPVTYHHFSLKMDRLFVYLSTTDKRKLVISSREGKKIVPISELKYVEIIKHKLTFHTLNGNIECSGTLKKVCGDLDGLSILQLL